MRNKNFTFMKSRPHPGGVGLPYDHSFIITVRDKEITKVYENADRGAGYIFLASKQKDLLRPIVDIINSKWVLLMKEYGHDTTKLEKALV